MAFLDQVYPSCENVIGAVNEPLNVVSSVAFFVAAWLLARKRRGATEFAGNRLALIVLLTLTGVGKAIYHLLPQHMTLVADAAPLAMLMAFMLYTVLRGMVGVEVAGALVLVGAFGVVSVLTRYIPTPLRLHDAVAYLPWLGALVKAASGLRRRGDGDGLRLLTACGVFALALAFRTVDMPICHLVPTGTHFLWHIGVAAALYLLAQVICERPTRRRAKSGLWSLIVLAVLGSTAVLVTMAVFPGEEPIIPAKEPAAVE